MRIDVQDRELRQGFHALVLCGGRGTRLSTVLPDCPKALAEVNGEPFLWRILDALAAAGCKHVVLCTGHLGDQIETACGRRHADMDISYSRESKALGTAGALGHASGLLSDSAPQGVLVLNGDSYIDIDLGAFVARAQSSNAKCLLVANWTQDTGRFGRLAIAADGTVLDFEEKRESTEPGYLNAGVYWLDSATFQALPRSREASLERETLPGLAAAGDLRASRHDAAFLDIGVPADLARVSDFFAAIAADQARDRKGLLVVDRDGTLIAERHYLSDPAGVELLPGVADGLRRFREAGYELAIVTNQSGIGRGYFGCEDAEDVNAEVLRQLGEHGVEVQGVYMCPHHPDAGCDCRKPLPGLFTAALDELGYQAEQCLVIGDKQCDVELGTRLGARTVLVRTGYGVATERDGMCAPDLIVNGLDELAATEVGR